MDGFAATKYIKSQPQGRETTIVALTASVLEEEKAITLAAGCDEFLRKPFREQSIFDTLTKYLGVQYIYAEEQIPESSPVIALTPDQLTCMPPEWRQQLHKAAIEGDVDLIKQLIAAIPASEVSLVKNLTDLAQQFKLEVIIDLVETLID
jgi:response regulator RpfG family c-di-GMP phosphodiesterase